MPNIDETYDTLSSFGKFHMISVDTPNFLALRKSGVFLPSNDHKLDQQDWRTPPGPVKTGSFDGTGYYDHNADGFNNRAGVNGSLPGTPVSDCLAEISTRLDDKVRSTDLDLGIAMGEFPETAEFITQAMTRTWKSFKFFKRGKISKALQTLTGRKNNSWKDIPGVASNTWLAYSFGLKPLLNDVYDATNLLEEGFRQPNKRLAARTGFSRELDQVDREWITNTAHQQYYIDTDVKGQLTCSGKVYYEVDNPLTANLDQLGLTNPASVVWELVPFSFVVDWFLPVGKYITSIVPPQGVTFQSGYTYVKGKGGSNRHSFRQTVTGSRHHNLYKTSKERFKIRNKLTAFPVPNVTIPDLELSQSKMVTAMALLWSVGVEGRRRS